jgi:DNA-binding transcriptional ArsR family regulator
LYFIATIPLLSLVISSPDFTFLPKPFLCNLTDPGNLSHQLKKLSEAGYVAIEKAFKGNYPQTICTLTSKGKKAFATYVENIKQYLHL